MEKVGDKATARDLMQKAGLPLLPGHGRPGRDRRRRARLADEIGYPVIIKAVAGGGGRGMTVVWKPRGARGRLPDDARDRAGGLQGQRRLHRALPARRRATPRSRSSATTHGNGVYFGERDCSVQRRHQKLIEEAPSIHLTPEMRKRHRREGGRRRALDRLHRRGDDGVPARPRRQLRVHGDERPHPGRAPGQRDDHGGRPDPGADPRRRRRAALGRRRTTSSSGATRSSAASTPRIPDDELRPDRGPARDVRRRRAGRGRASTRTATRAGWSARSTTR